MISLFKKVNPLFRKVAGGYFAIVGSLVFIGLLITAFILYSGSGVTINWFQYFVSNLGIGPNGSSVVFTIACVVEALLLYPFIFQVCAQIWMEPSQDHARLNNRLIIVAFITAMFSLAGLIVLGVFNMGATIIPHAIGAMTFFFGTIIFGGIFLVSFELRKQSTWMLRLTSGLVLGFFIAFIVAVLVVQLENPAQMQQFLADPMTAIASILGNSTDMTLMWVRFNEWWYILAMLGWSLYLGMHSIKLSKAEKKIA